jgi:hypothetical protein
VVGQPTELPGVGVGAGRDERVDLAIADGLDEWEPRRVGGVGSVPKVA